jgi:hypothetical protein
MRRIGVMKRLVAGMLAAVVVSACGAPTLGMVAAPRAQPNVQSESLFGWWGENGRQRALDKFSKEEARRINMIEDARGSRLEAKLSPSESALLSKLLSIGAGGQKSIERSQLIDGLKRKAIRHLKLFRRQKMTQDSSRTLNFFKIADAGKTLAYSADTKNGYQAFYTDKGRLIVAFVAAQAATMAVDAVPPPEDAEPDE